MRLCPRRPRPFARRFLWRSRAFSWNLTVPTPLLFADGRPVGTLRAFTEDGGTRWHIGRVAVIQSARQLHLGRRMMDLAEAELRRRGAAGIEVSAQCRVQPFYEKCGFTSVGEVYLDEFCPHIRMVKELE